MHIRTRFFPEYRRLRKFWGDGPWEGEPDFAGFWHVGFSCEVGRSRMGSLCGYVLVPEGHPWFGLERGRVPCDVHGDTTYCQADPDGRWRVGFDCGHFGDRIPIDTNSSFLPRSFKRRMKRIVLYGRGTYRTMPWVIRETQYLAEQAREACV